MKQGGRKVGEVCSYIRPLSRHPAWASSCLKNRAGKSTLTAWLISHGCRYITDEMVYIVSMTNAISGFVRPVTIKSSGRHLLPELLKDSPETVGIVKSESVDMITPEYFGAEVLVGDSPLSLIIFPRYQPGQTNEMHQLSKAQTAFEMMKCLANARNLSQHGLSEVVRLAESTPAHQLIYENLYQAGHCIL